jgi:hypothetical protein
MDVRVIRNDEGTGREERAASMIEQERRVDVVDSRKNTDC